MTLAQARLFDAIDTTWPTAARVTTGPWVLREGRGGGKRVSAATLSGELRDGDIPTAEEAMRRMGQAPLFMLRPGEEALDSTLADLGYETVDVTRLRVCPVWQLTDREIPRVTTFTLWEPLAIMREIWAEGGIGPDRLAVMERVSTPKTAILGRIDDHPAGTAFCALDGDVAMVHALEIRQAHRGKGLGGWIMRAAAAWAEAQGAAWMTCLHTQQNAGAEALYSSLGMTDIGSYHYRILPNPGAGAT
ncbi:GNAT family N-acetyltransferase [Allosediminivita pacifica]|uniref:Acetyltransferase (GNAT) family protein n=1 Tax=Allosediminivita pacifica TaxID=1267769 RepID=A0A2T6AZG3_9RHOB|nr:GNAT family N-acetyltransferase [Allosediminivita pacifica]PTX49173.1 acetyltransferase (GNAT) family protein [Allosediminivita pacifica]GGB06150.1 N-acetyltransferase [Allosediminivita pacifica]